jgi:predicted AlkP superfamily pyrophosphatase or phosphodiesterase
VAYVYWPEYDTYCHGVGCYHRETRAHLGEVDQSLARLVDRLQGTDSVLFVLADHGLVDTPLKNQFDLAEVPGLYDCLAVVPSGDARQVCCFVRPAKVRRFLDIVKKHLSRACVCVSDQTLIKARAFGPGKPHPSLGGRVGDYVLIAKDGHAFSSTLPGMKGGFNVGNHGGMSEAEVMVPLYTVRC